MSTVASGLTNPNTNYNNGKKIVCDSNGILYCCFYATINSYSQIFIYKSIDNGNTWINMNFPQITGYYQDTPNIAIDSNNVLHIVWRGCDSNNPSYSQIKYSNNVNGSWSTWINIQTISGYNQYSPSIGIDSNNKIHITWYGTDLNNSTYSQIKYSNNINGSWGNWINIQTLTGYDQQRPSIGIDSNNKIHITWYGGDSNNLNYTQIKYSNNISGNWGTWVNIQTITGYNQYNPSITINNNNKLHIVWYGQDINNTAKNQIKYSNNVSGSWSNWENIQPITGYNQYNPSITIDSNDKIHIIWHGWDSNNSSYYQIKYSNNVSGSWSNWINKTNSTTFSYQNPSCIYKNEKLYCIYKGSTTIEFFNINIISNKYLIKDGDRIKITDGINLIDLGTIYNEEIFNTYGMNNLTNINPVVLEKIINNDYKILMYKKRI